MSDRSGIEWTDATWNPVTGCTKVSAGCDHCYAETLAHRLLQGSYGRRLPVVDTPAARRDPFALRLWPERLAQPSRWRKPRVVFVNSMSDLFHVNVPDVFQRRVFEVMLRETRHVYQVLTKRPARAARFLRLHADLLRGRPVPGHIWLGTSMESQDVHHRVRQLQEVPAMIRFLSCEPLLGPLRVDLRGVSWVIVGGESGPVRRPMELDWARRIRDDCLAEGVPFFFKQVGGRTHRSGGRLLDGRTWDELPVLGRREDRAASG